MKTTAIKIELNSKQKEELRKIYSWYMGISRTDFETKEEYEAERKEAMSDYEENFPDLKNAQISIYDLPKLIYTTNQLLFIEDAKETEFEIDYGYSGRGMYGDVCPAIRCHDHNDITTKAKTRIDGMGLGVVIYAEY